jgi:hypothetical protein
MTDVEKISWARQHHVQPPSFVLDRLAEAAPIACMESVGCSMCAKAAVDRPSESLIASTATPETRVVLLDAQLRCQGVGAWITLLSSALPVSRDVQIEREALAFFFQHTGEPNYVPPDFSPPYPPPDHSLES